MKKIIILISLTGILFSNGDGFDLTVYKVKYGVTNCTLPIGIKDTGINPGAKIKENWGDHNLEIITLRNSGLVPVGEEYIRPEGINSAEMIGIIANYYGTGGKFQYSNMLADHYDKSYNEEFFLRKEASEIGVISRSIGHGTYSRKMLKKFQDFILPSMRNGQGAVMFTAAGNGGKNLNEYRRWSVYESLDGVIPIGFLDSNGERTSSDFPATSGHGNKVIYIKSHGYKSYYPLILNEKHERFNHATTSRMTAYASSIGNLALCVNPKLTSKQLESIVRAAAPENEHGYYVLVPADVLRFSHALKHEYNYEYNASEQEKVSADELASTLKELRRILPLVELNVKINPGWNLLGVGDKYSLKDFTKYVKVGDNIFYRYETGAFNLNGETTVLDKSMWIKNPKEVSGGLWIKRVLGGQDKYDLEKK